MLAPRRGHKNHHFFPFFHGSALLHPSGGGTTPALFVQLFQFTQSPPERLPGAALVASGTYLQTKDVKQEAKEKTDLSHQPTQAPRADGLAPPGGGGGKTSEREKYFPVEPHRRKAERGGGLGKEMNDLWHEVEDER